MTSRRNAGILAIVLSIITIVSFPRLSRPIEKGKDIQRRQDNHHFSNKRYRFQYEIGTKKGTTTTKYIEMSSLIVDPLVYKAGEKIAYTLEFTEPPADDTVFVTFHLISLPSPKLIKVKNNLPLLTTAATVPNDKWFDIVPKHSTNKQHKAKHTAKKVPAETKFEFWATQTDANGDTQYLQAVDKSGQPAMITISP